MDPIKVIQLYFVSFPVRGIYIHLFITGNVLLKYFFSVLYNVSDPPSDDSVFIAKNVNWCPSQRCSVLHHILMDSTKNHCHKEELAR